MSNICNAEEQEIPGMIVFLILKSPSTVLTMIFY